MSWISRIRALFERERLEKRLGEELEFHLAMREQLNADQGMPPAEARRNALLRFGNPAMWRERTSEIDLMLMPQTILQDLRFGARALCRHAGFTTAAILALALGIGVNTTVFTCYRAVISRPLDARDPGRMVDLALVLRSGDFDPGFSFPDYEAYRDHLRSFSGVIAQSVDRLTLTDTGGIRTDSGASPSSLLRRLGLLPTSSSAAEFANTLIVSKNYFSVLGIAPLRGRTFEAMTALELNTSPIRSRRLGSALIAAQVAGSLVLMIVGSLLIRSAVHTLKLDTGYDSKQAVNLHIQFPDRRQFTADRKVALIRELRARLAAVPGVTAITTARPPDGGGMRTAAVSVNGEQPSPQNTTAFIYYTYVQANYFQTLGIPLLFGRSFQTQEGTPEPSVVVSASAANRLWPNQNPIGRSISMSTEGQFHQKGEVLPDETSFRVIGVARDIRGVQLDGSDSQQIYLPLPENRVADYPLLIRIQSDPQLFMSTIGPVISAIDSNLVATSSTLDEMLRLTPPFVVSGLAAVFASSIGLLGLALASMGIFGTVSYTVVLRTREVGIRMALGAKKRDVLELMLRETTRPVVAGLLIGASLAVGVSYLIRGILYGLNTIDVFSFAGVPLLFLGISLFAAYLPSRRAMRVDPIEALRYE